MNTLTKDLIFPKLGMGYNDLEPYIDAMTMEIHYTKHHRAYYDNLMNAMVFPSWASMFGNMHII
ncbi:MAG: hypothetical protein KBF06_07420 [Bacteroidales bacterium]|jgi:superoxide dismutase|nr:hypothetical protein [Bacteroidales bacterium]MBP9512299.1 hypothetical protein [Bacteroidales bacterium]MBP9588838.1 hypothetical protein [Bacteroidales bacterium]NMD16290.1 hypothetical protein [Bacteroidales bacterium]